MAITYGAQVSARCHMYQSTQSDPKLCFILVLNSSKLQHYSLEKILKPVNHPSLIRSWDKGQPTGKIQPLR